MTDGDDLGLNMAGSMLLPGGIPTVSNLGRFQKNLQMALGVEDSAHKAEN